MHMNDDMEDIRPESESVVAAVDDIESRDHLVIADVSRDDAWIAVPESQAWGIRASR